jgi:Fe2+ transport system protein FeoA
LNLTFFINWNRTTIKSMTLADARLGELLTIAQVGGRGGFRRRLLELGLLPGTLVTVKSVAPLGDPIELLVRGASLSIRKEEAATVRVTLDAKRQSPTGLQ